MSATTRLAALMAGAAALAVPAAAHAATKSVFMGVPPSVSNTFNTKYSTDVDDYFPHTVTVHVGDSVKFLPVGFHTADFPGRLKNPFGLVAPSGTISGANDAAGQAFWFNGKDNLQFNPKVIQGSLGKKVTFNGSNTVESGLPLSQRPQPMTVKFTKKGSFTFYCDVHPGMKGTVKVVAPKAKVPSAKADAKTVKKMIARDLAEAKKFPSTIVPSGTIKVGLHKPNGVEYFGFMPANPTVKVGTTIVFKMDNGSLEDHTASTGPGTFNQNGGGSGYLFDLANSFNSPTLDQRAVYPSEAPGSTPAQLTPQLHGNGFWNTGVLDTSNRTPLPASGEVTFAAAGTYQFYCLIHTFMHATVTVTQ